MRFASSSMLRRFPVHHGEAFTSTVLLRHSMRVALILQTARLGASAYSYAMRAATWFSSRLACVPYFWRILYSAAAISVLLDSGCTDEAGSGFAVPGSAPMSARYAITSRSGKKRKVSAPSHTSTTSLLTHTRMTSSHTYAKIEKQAVTVKTPMSLMYRTSPSGMAATHTAEMTRRLKAALPTIVDGPSSPLRMLLVIVSSITLRRISGALEPRAMRERFAMVLFQTLTVMVLPAFLQ
mmetsp:Transcript_91064/g.235124  ORF Transcript_91064/g.235124 Transcript_91064/m.235124 type:complete len:238 (+) Transcript_91064:1065-1778(+)